MNLLPIPWVYDIVAGCGIEWLNDAVYRMVCGKLGRWGRLELVLNHHDSTVTMEQSLLWEATIQVVSERRIVEPCHNYSLRMCL